MRVYIFVMGTPPCFRTMLVRVLPASSPYPVPAQSESSRQRCEAQALLERHPTWNTSRADQEAGEEAEQAHQGTSQALGHLNPREPLKSSVTPDR